MTKHRSLLCRLRAAQSTGGVTSYAWCQANISCVLYAEVDLTPTCLCDSLGCRSGLCFWVTCQSQAALMASYLPLGSGGSGLITVCTHNGSIKWTSGKKKHTTWKAFPSSCAGSYNQHRNAWPPFKIFLLWCKNPNLQDYASISVRLSATVLMVHNFTGYRWFVLSLSLHPFYKGVPPQS